MLATLDDTRPPLISVAIPTRQRREYLEATLASVLEQAEEVGGEVVVSDNASRDGTRELLDSFRDRPGRLHIHTQPENVGLDRNMRDVATLCRGEYVWMLGDDDAATPGSLRRIADMLRRAPDLLVLQGWHADANLAALSPLLDADLAGRRFVDARSAFASLWDRMPFSAFVVRRTHLVADRWERYLGTSHAYSGVVWDSLALAQESSPHHRIAVVVGTEPDVMLRRATKTWSSEEARIQFEQIPAWFDLLPAVFEVEREAARREHMRHSMRKSYVRELRARGQVDVRYMLRVTRRASLLDRIRALAISALPVSVARTWERWRGRGGAAGRKLA